jgi:hypothetical protein
LPTNSFERGIIPKGEKILDQENSQLIIQSLDFTQGLQSDVNTLQSEMDQAQTDINVIEADYLKASNISDVTYNQSTWNAVTTIAPSKNTVRDKFESLSTGVSQSDFNAALMIGSANSEWIPCMYNGSWGHDEINIARTVSNAGATDLVIIYSLPLPTNRGGKKLYLGDFLVHLHDADASNYIHYVDIYGMSFGSETLLYTDGTNRMAASANATQYTYATAIGDVSAYYNIQVQIRTVNATANDLDISNVLLKCYYDT